MKNAARVARLLAQYISRAVRRVHRTDKAIADAVDTCAHAHPTQRPLGIPG